MERKQLEKIACVVVALFSSILCVYTIMRCDYYDDCFSNVVGSHKDRYTRFMLDMANVRPDLIILLCGLGFLMLVPACMNRTFSRTVRAALVGYFLFLGPVYYFVCHEGYVTVAMESLKYYSQAKRVEIEQTDVAPDGPNP